MSSDVAALKICGSSAEHAARSSAVKTGGGWTAGSVCVAKFGEGEASVVSELIHCVAALQARVEKMSGTIHRNLIANRWVFILSSSKVLDIIV